MKTELVKTIWKRTPILLEGILHIYRHQQTKNIAMATTSAFPSGAAALRTTPERRTSYGRRKALRKPRHFAGPPPPTPPDPAPAGHPPKPSARPIPSRPATRRDPRRHPGPAEIAAPRTGRRHSGTAARPSLPRRSPARRNAPPAASRTHLPGGLRCILGGGWYFSATAIQRERQRGCNAAGRGRERNGGKKKERKRKETKGGRAPSALHDALPSRPGCDARCRLRRAAEPRCPPLSERRNAARGRSPSRPRRARPGPRIAARRPRRPGARRRTEGAGGVTVPASDAEGRSRAGPLGAAALLFRRAGGRGRRGRHGGRGPPGPERGAHLPERGSPSGGGGRGPGTSGAGRGARSRLPAPPGSPRGRSGAQPAAARGRQRGLGGGGEEGAVCGRGRYGERRGGGGTGLGPWGRECGAAGRGGLPADNTAGSLLPRTCPGQDGGRERAEVTRDSH